MTLIRRAARTASSPQHSNRPDGNEEPSKETKIMAESAKLYLENHYKSLFEHRTGRRDQIQQIKDNPELSEEEKQQLIEKFKQDESDYTRKARSKIKPERFERIKLIGRGGFGEVWLVFDQEEKKYYALKVLRKADIIMTEQIQNVRTERDILAHADNPWFTALNCSFQDDSRLYLVLEYVCGGDLMNALIKKGFFDNDTAKFCAAEIALAVHSVHELHFLHRDLKPDNILICENGHLKLTDFGLSKNYQDNDTHFQKLNDDIIEFISGRPFDQPSHNRGTEIGTCTYTAPEIIRGKPPTTLSDFWSLGVILYEMLYGFVPFMGQTARETQLKINFWKKCLMFPKIESRPVSPEAVDLIQHLLCEPEDRYGFEQIIAHPFFEGFDFQNPFHNDPPMIPVLKSPSDTSHFEEIEPSEDSLASEIPIAQNVQNFAFLGFTYKQKNHRRIASVD